jgi:hypothetical protein
MNFKIEQHVVTDGLVQSTFVLIFSIDFFFIVSYQFELVTGGFSMMCPLLFRGFEGGSRSIVR